MSGAMGAAARACTDAQADSLNMSLGAQAFTTGSNVFLSQGRYNPGSTAGRRLIAPEFTHVVQQSGGDAERALDAGQARLKRR